MKKIFVLLIVICLAGVNAFAQGLPPVPLKNLLGETTLASEIDNDGNPIVVSFWATWCKPCIKELNTIQDMYEDWQDETGVKIIAISIDDARNAALVAPFVNGRDWPYDVFIDENSDLKRAMNVVNIPHVFLLDGETKNIVWQHTSYAPGDEEELYDQIVELKEGK